MLHETLEYLGIAFVSSALLIIMSKIILQALIRRPADYYDARELKEEELMLNAAGISIAREHETSPEGEPLEDTHLEAHITEFTAAEPEEIITDIPEAVYTSIEITPDDEEPEKETENPIDMPVPDDTDEDNSVPESDNEAEEPEYIEEPETSEPEPETAAEPEIPEPETVPAAQEPESEPVEDVPETSEPVTEPAHEPELEPGVQGPDATESESSEVGRAKENQADSDKPDYTFSIKAKTSRVKQPKRKEDEEKAEEEAAARAAIEAARAASSEDRVPEWTESYEDIRQSLEKAFIDSETEETHDASGAQEQSADTEQSAGQESSKRRRKRKRKPKPSMKMNKKELTDIAVSRGIDVPEEATKREILDMIYGGSDQE